MIIRAGDLDRVITILQLTGQTISASRTVTATWTPLVTLRAKLIEASAIDTLRNGGTFDDATRIFLVRWLDGVTTDDRITYLDTTYAIKGVTEIGRRIGIQFRCEALQGSVE